MKITYSNNMPLNLVDEIKDWLAADNFGTQANRLRSAAFCIMDEAPDTTGAEFVAACVSLGVNAGTAKNRWHEVKRQA